ncbi:alpha-galactosidase [Streptococcus thoraltensis]|uniref:alpha-galactosidase n=1 Tax=Streptococcus thoraltensis TaxID=55085 RepID=UPI001F5A7B0F|nr:alpha-galactosidase [Streptococcus thoraltensis]
MTLNISFSKETQLFHLTNGDISYIIEIVHNSYLAHRYWGKALRNYGKYNQVPMYKKTFAASPYANIPEFSLEFLPMEFPQSYQGDFKNPAIRVRGHKTIDQIRLKYHSHNIISGLPRIPDLPHARESGEDFAKTLIISMIDDIAEIKVDLYYSMFENSNAIIRSSKMTNLGSSMLSVEQLASASIDCYYQGQNVTTMHGSHQKEFQLDSHKIHHGQFKTGTSRGASGPQYVPFIALSENNSETSGEVHALSLIYSGNHTELVERDQYNQIRLQIGLNADQFSWILEKNQSFYSPQAVLVYSPNGFNGMSQIFHDFTTNHIVPPHFRNDTAPILINSWEMTYFDVDEQKMDSLIDKACELGFEAVVLDDGWFLGRNNSKTSLGDWMIDKRKFPNDLHQIVNKTHLLGLKFGIWFEPEMISPDSQLLNHHPDWVMKSKWYEPLLGRNQYVLDLAQIEVQDFLISTISNFIHDYKIDYIKWDMNRHITEPFSQINTLQHPKAYSHQYMLGLYKVINHLTSKYPDVLFENCSSGGGRFDFGMLYYFPQTWASDNTDGLDRQEIQYGASYLFHPYQMTGHVSVTPNHQTQRQTPLTARQNLASSTNMGYELDILKLEESDVILVKEHIEQYKHDRKLISSSNFYRLSSPFNSNLTAWLFESKNKSEYILTVFRNRFQVNEHHHIIKIPYLNPDADYIFEENSAVISGTELIYSGIHLQFEKKDWDSIVLHFSKK